MKQVITFILINIFLLMFSMTAIAKNNKHSVPKKVKSLPNKEICGGIADIQCENGKQCLTGNEYPDAYGVCVKPKKIQKYLKKCADTKCKISCPSGYEHQYTGSNCCGVCIAVIPPGNSLKNKIFVGNIPMSFDKQTLIEMFESHGALDSAAIITDRDTGRPRGFGFVEMFDDDEARNAISTFENFQINGITLKINEFKSKPDCDDSGDNRGSGRNRGCSDWGENDGHCINALDCDGLIHITCAGSWTCEEQLCQYNCDTYEPAGGVLNNDSIENISGFSVACCLIDGSCFEGTQAYCEGLGGVAHSGICEQVNCEVP